MKLTTTKGRVATVPFPDMAVKTVVRGRGSVGVGAVENKLQPVALLVVAPSEDGRFMVGHKVLVRASAYGEHWAKAIQTLDGFTYSTDTGSGTDFILVPESAVEAIVHGG